MSRDEEKFRILVYNTQLMKQGESFLAGLLESSHDIYCFSRVSREFVEGRRMSSIFEPSFPGSRFGLAILSRHPVEGRSIHSMTKRFHSSSQSSAILSAKVRDTSVVLTLPPYEEAREATREDYRRHVDRTFEVATSDSIVVGDFHFEAHEVAAPSEWHDFARTRNFVDPSGKWMTLSHLFSREDLQVAESIIDVPTPQPGTHFPISFELTRTVTRGSDPGTGL